MYVGSFRQLILLVKCKGRVAGTEAREAGKGPNQRGSWAFMLSGVGVLQGFRQRKDIVDLTLKALFW